MRWQSVVAAFAAFACVLIGFSARAEFVKYVPVTVSGYSGAALSDFPVLVKLDATSVPGVYSDVKNAGADLKFTDGSGDGDYPYEVDTWNPSGTSCVWVKLPSFAAGAEFRMYYGDSFKTDNPSAADVWTGYDLVCHVNPSAGDSSATYDSSPKNHPGKLNPDGAAVTGVIGNAYGLSSSVADKGAAIINELYQGSAAGVLDDSEFSYSFWVRRTGTFQTWQPFVGPRNSANADCWGIGTTGSNIGASLYFWATQSSKDSVNIPNGMEVDVWRKIDVVQNASGVVVYCDGVKAGEKTFAVPKRCWVAWMGWGGSADQPGAFAGKSVPADFDECRVYGSLMSADMIAANYALETRNDIFTFGDPRPGVDPHKNRTVRFSTTDEAVVFCEPGSYGWTAPMNATGFRVLVVGGGGGGGGNAGGGGGGGEVVYREAFPLTPGGAYTVTVGAGGAAGGNIAVKGGDSSLYQFAVGTVLTASGGGPGSGGWDVYNSGAALNGANGGGAGGNGPSVKAGGSPTATGGHAGGMSGNYGGGGGGGMGEDGHNATAATEKSYGGAGVICGITGEEKMYGYGGGGRTGGLGGARDGYGNGWKSATEIQTAGEVGTGGGGGGGKGNDGSAVGAAGGSGAVVIRYTLQNYPSTTSVSVSRSADARESGLVPGGFIFSCSESGRGSDVAVRYSVGGTAKPGQTYEPLSGVVVIPAGQTSIAVPVYPLSDRVVDFDSTVTVTISSDPTYTVGINFSATLKVVNDPSSTNARIRYIKPDGNDANDGLAPPTAYATLKKALSALGSEGGTVYVLPGEYVDTAATKSAVTADDANGLWYSYYQILAPVTIVGAGAVPEDVVFKWATCTSPTGVSPRIFYINNPSAKLKNLTVRGSRAGVPNGPKRREECGGSNVFIDTLGGTLEDCLIDNGSQQTWAVGGGNIQMYGGRVIRCRIVNGIQGASHLRYSPDSGNNLGSGIYMKGGIVENSLLTGNGTDMNSACTVLMRGDSKLLNCTIAGNGGYQCAGVAVQSANCAVRNCAIFNNACASDSSGFGHVFAGVISGDKSREKLATVFFGCAANAFINESCAESTDGGFVDQGSGDYHLGTTSCCRDRAEGYSASGASSGTDLDGLPRKMGVREDIGCFEFDTSRLSVDFFADVTEGIVRSGGVGFPVKFTAVVEGEYDGALTFEWDLNGDGTPDRTVVGDNTLSCSYQECGSDGYFDVGLTVSAGSQSVSASKGDYIHVGPSDIYVDHGSSGGEFPYDAEAKAAPNLYTALTAALSGSTVHLAAGEYVWNGANRPNVNVGTRILGGTDDPKDTVIRYNKASLYANAMLLKVNHPEAFVANITFQDGFVFNDGSNMPAAGIHVTGNGGTVSNCVIKGCSASETSSSLATGGVRIEGGLLTHCILDDDRMYNVGAPSYMSNSNARKTQGLYATGPSRIENCLFRNMNTDGCLILLGNDSKGEAPVMRNCTIIDCSFNFWTDNNGSNPNRVQWPCAAIECLDGKGKVHNTVFCNVRRRAYHNSNQDVEIPAADCVPFSRNTRASTEAAYNDVDTDARCCIRCASDGTVRINSACVLMTSEDFVDRAAGDLTPKTGGVLHDGGNPVAGWSSICDLSGRRRVVDDLDIGCYEQQSGGLIKRYYVDCLFTGESTGRREAPFKTIREGCEAATQVASEVYVRGGPDRVYTFADCNDSAAVSADSNKVYGCDAEWNPSVGYVDVDSLAKIRIADDYAAKSYTLKGNKKDWPAPFEVKASSTVISGFLAEFGPKSYKQQDKGGEGLISISGGVSGTTVENCRFQMTGTAGAYEGAGVNGVVSGLYIDANSTPRVLNTLIRRCYFRLQKYRAQICVWWDLQQGTRFEENFVCNLDTLYTGGCNSSVPINYYIVSNIFLNCSNGATETAYKSWLIGGAGNFTPAGGEIAYNRFIHNAEDGVSTRYRLFQHGNHHGGSWYGDTCIHHNTIVGYEVAFESPLYNSSNGALWSPKIFDNIIVSDSVFSEEAVGKWASNSIQYDSSFKPGSMFRNNAVLAEKFVTGSATSFAWYDIGENLEGTNTTEFIDAMPAFVNTSDPLSENYYRLRVPSAPWVINAWVGDNPGFQEFPRYLGAVAPQPGGFAVRIR